MLLFISIFYLIIVVSYFYPKRKQIFINPIFIYAGLNLLLFIGSVKYIDLENTTDRIHIILYFVALFSFLIGVSLATKVNRFSQNDLNKWYDKPLMGFSRINVTVRLIVAGVLVISLVVTFIYYYMIGYNIFILSFKSIITTGDLLSGLTELRLNTYSGENYFAPGYVNQFKNTLLPMMVLYYIIKTILYPKRINKLFIMLLLIILLVSLGGTGQRGSLVVALIIFIVGINLSFKPNFTKKINVFLITFGLLAFILLSVFLQREVSSLSEVNIYSSLLSVYNRIFNSNQDSSVIAFRLIYSFDKSYGYDWYMTLLQILPGKLEYLPISNRVFEIMYGSTRGTGTISMLGSTYYNFGTMGIITINFIVGFTLQYLFIRLIRRDKSVFRVLYYSVLFVTLGMWVSEGPSYLVNAGFVTAIIFAFLSKFFYKRRYNYENIDINGSIQ